MFKLEEIIMKTLTDLFDAQRVQQNLPNENNDLGDHISKYV